MDRGFLKNVLNIAVPVALQSMLQSSFSIVDQVMVGQLGASEIAAVEIGGKPCFIFNCVMGAVTTVAGIMISQYLGKKDDAAVQKSISVNLLATGIVSIVFCASTISAAGRIAGLFTKDGAVIGQATAYIRITSAIYLFNGIQAVLSTQLRCVDKARLPLYAGGAAALINTALNYLLIFGKAHFPALGVRGAAVSSVISALCGFLLVIASYLKINGGLHLSFRLKSDDRGAYLAMLLPVVFNELMWAVGQNVYTAIYGHIGTPQLAAMSLTGPIQGLVIGALSGIAQAAGILTGKQLGESDYIAAYKNSIRLCLYGLAGSIALGALLIAQKNLYLSFFKVDAAVRTTGSTLLFIFAVLCPVKVLNMILGGGVIRSGGRTKYIMIIDLCGTWLIGVPIGLLAGFVWHLPVTWVYFLLSQEELFRFIISVRMFRSKRWMQTL